MRSPNSARPTSASFSRAIAWALALLNLRIFRAKATLSTTFSHASARGVGRRRRDRRPVRQSACRRAAPSPSVAAGSRRAPRASRLAAARGADRNEKSPAAHLEIDVREGDKLTLSRIVADRQIPRFEDRRPRDVAPPTGPRRPAEFSWRPLAGDALRRRRSLRRRRRKLRIDELGEVVGNVGDAGPAP